MVQIQTGDCEKEKSEKILQPQKEEVSLQLPGKIAGDPLNRNECELPNQETSDVTDEYDSTVDFSNDEPGNNLPEKPVPAEDIMTTLTNLLERRFQFLNFERKKEQPKEKDLTSSKFKFYCTRCCQLQTCTLNQSHQQAAYAWAFIFIISGGILWSWLPFVLQDFRERAIRCPKCEKLLWIDKHKMAVRTERLFLVLLIVDFLILISIAFYNLFII